MTARDRQPAGTRPAQQPAHAHTRQQAAYQSAAPIISSMGRRWRDAGISIADTLFQYRFVQQFAALFYKNGEAAGGDRQCQGRQVVCCVAACTQL